MGQRMEFTLRQNIMIQFLYVILNKFRDMHENIESVVILLCKLLLPKVLVTVLKKLRVWDTYRGMCIH